MVEAAGKKPWEVSEAAARMRYDVQDFLAESAASSAEVSLKLFLGMAVLGVCMRTGPQAFALALTAADEFEFLPELRMAAEQYLKYTDARSAEGVAPPSPERKRHVQMLLLVMTRLEE